MQQLLQVNHITCQHGQKSVLSDISFTLAAGEIACLLGPSGCGKTTLLHAIAGFQSVAAGSIDFDGKTIASRYDSLPAEQRHIGLVFQDYALFPHLSVADNIAFGLNRMPRSTRQERVRELLRLVRLEHFAERFAHQLSGGQQQRVALARALAPQPCLLLLDEPFSNLDTQLRRGLASEVRRIIKQIGTAALLVTHDRDEAFVAADKLGIMGHGQLLQWDTPENVYQVPASADVARMTASGNLLQGVVTSDNLVQTAMGMVPTAEPGFQPGSRVQVYVRSGDIAIGKHPYAATVSVTGRDFIGAECLYQLQLTDGQNVEVRLPSSLELGGESVSARISRALIFAL